MNNASDSPSDILRINRFDAQRRGNIVAQRNIQEGMTMLQVADDALSQISDIGKKIKELGVQYQNDTLSEKDRGLIEFETKELYKEIENISKNTKFNGISIFQDKNMSIQTGANQGEKLDISFKSFSFSLSNKEPLPIVTGNGHEIDTANINQDSPSLFPTVSFFSITNEGDTNDRVIDKDTNWSEILEENNWTDSGTEINGKLNGYIEIKDENGKSVLNGYFVNDKLNGWAEIFKDDETIRTGYFNNNVLNGWGEVSYENGEKFSGRLYNGVQNGWGTLTDADGTEIENGLWINGRTKRYNEGFDTPIEPFGSVNNNIPIEPPIDNGNDNDIPIEPPTDNGDDNDMPIEPPIDNDNDNDLPIEPPIDNNDTNIPTEPPVDNNDYTPNVPIEQPKVPNYLNLDSIDENILSKVDSFRSYIGVKTNMLEYRYESQLNQEQNNSKALSNVQDANVAKELMESVKNKMLLDSSQAMFANNLDNHREYILKLLR